MRIENIIPDFLTVYESNQDFRMADLEKYINKHPDVFNAILSESLSENRRTSATGD